MDPVWCHLNCMPCVTAICNLLISLSMVICQDLQCFCLTGVIPFKASHASKVCRPYLLLLTSQRGDSGTNQISRTCMTDGRACNAEGILQDQLLWIWKVPKVCYYSQFENIWLRYGHYRPCSTGSPISQWLENWGPKTYVMLPEYLRTIIRIESEGVIVLIKTYQSALYMDVSWARWVGYASSVTRRGAPDVAKVNPNPIKMLRTKMDVQYWLFYELPRYAPSTDEHADRAWCRL